MTSIFADCTCKECIIKVNYYSEVNLVEYLLDNFPTTISNFFNSIVAYGRWVS